MHIVAYCVFARRGQRGRGALPARSMLGRSRRYRAAGVGRTQGALHTSTQPAVPRLPPERARVVHSHANAPSCTASVVMAQESAPSLALDPTSPAPVIMNVHLAQPCPTSTRSQYYHEMPIS
eukprot:scaffold7303_cov108-Isochrysis_galbana.AAC.2